MAGKLVSKLRMCCAKYTLGFENLVPQKAKHLIQNFTVSALLYFGHSGFITTVCSQPFLLTLFNGTPMRHSRGSPSGAEDHRPAAGGTAARVPRRLPTRLTFQGGCRLCGARWLRPIGPSVRIRRPLLRRTRLFREQLVPGLEAFLHEQLHFLPPSWVLSRPCLPRRSGVPVRLPVWRGPLP